jgi:pyruvate/2-oxoglutarate dehydrogenase complex dihydrolipoamide acyltransferase (E2) component
MIKLSDTQAVILSAASQRNDGAVLPLPKTLRIKGGAVDKVLGSLKTKGLIAPEGTPRGDDQPPLCITRAGLTAIGVEPEDEPATTPVPVTDAPQDAPDAEEAGTAGQEPQAPTEPAQAAQAPAAAKAKAAKAKPAKPAQAASADKPTVRPCPSPRRAQRDRPITKNLTKELRIDVLLRPGIQRFRGRAA